ncbi:MAG: flagellin lysine-N-methylase [Lachnospiraceae bacterium]|nr:flagellin lysine-N-methylase [Lachnospiraceae bacterium]MDD3614655.1 flagellin lysine-N-methylase [Lachnospiraceae bacterium]
MLYTRPDYYNEFHCVADLCEDTCCAGWQIVSDAKSLRKYHAVKGAFRKRLRRSIDWRKSAFRQDGEKRCTFLNDDNLCDMYINLGEGSLCRTCRLYPRHVEVFENVREITLSISCPEVADILMKRVDPVRFVSVEREGEDVFDDYDPFLYSVLADARDEMIVFLQNRSMPVEVRVGMCLGLAHDMQIRVDREELFSCFDVMERYKKDCAAVFVVRDLSGQSHNLRFAFVKRIFGLLEVMEFLKEDWYVQIKETQARLFGKNEQHWGKITDEFQIYMSSRDVPWEIQKEQLLVYFIFTYFCGAVYDGRLYSKVQAAAASVMIIEEMLKCRWIRNEKQIYPEDVTEIVYRYSREIEHSDQNLKKFEELVHKNWRGR